MWSRTKSYGRLTGYITQIMSLLLVLQVPVIQFVLGTNQDRLSHTTDGVTAFHVSFLSLYCSQNDSCLNVFITEGKRIFHVLVLSLVRLGNGFASGRISYGQASTYRPRPTYYVTVLVFVCLYICTTLATLQVTRFSMKVLKLAFIYTKKYGTLRYETFYIQESKHFEKSKTICVTFFYIQKARHFALRNFSWNF